MDNNEKCCRRSMFHKTLCKSMPDMTDAGLIADDEYVVAGRTARRCGRADGDDSPLPAPTRYSKSPSEKSTERFCVPKINRSQSQPNFQASDSRAEIIDDLIMLALKRVVSPLANPNTHLSRCLTMLLRLLIRSPQSRLDPLPSKI